MTGHCNAALACFELILNSDLNHLLVDYICYRFKYTTKFSLPKFACPAIVYAEIVVVIDLFFVGVCPWIKVYRYNPTEICQQRLQGVRNVAQKLCSWERSLLDKFTISQCLKRQQGVKKKKKKKKIVDLFRKCCCLIFKEWQGNLPCIWMLVTVMCQWTKSSRPSNWY